MHACQTQNWWYVHTIVAIFVSQLFSLSITWLLQYFGDVQGSWVELFHHLISSVLIDKAKNVYPDVNICFSLMFILGFYEL